jgi:hypothetical protein
MIDLIRFEDGIHSRCKGQKDYQFIDEKYRTNHRKEGHGHHNAAHVTRDAAAGSAWGNHNRPFSDVHRQQSTAIARVSEVCHTLTMVGVCPAYNSKFDAKHLYMCAEPLAIRLFACFGKRSFGIVGSWQQLRHQLGTC